MPLVTERSTTIIESVERASAEAVYDFVISELKALVASSGLENEDNTGRFNKRAANHYLAKAYLSKGYLTNNSSDFTEALNAAKAAGAGNALNTPFATLFSNAGEKNEELLFFVEYDLNTVRNNANAAMYVNIVRSRANATTATADEMSIDYILNERARELAGEYHRWADLSRTGKLAEYVEAHNPDISAGQVTDKFLLRPIPLAAIELNPGLAGQQNPGF